eukprot:6105978-Pyramimonas_sp.AAC.1
MPQGVGSRLRPGAALGARISVPKNGRGATGRNSIQTSSRESVLAYVLALHTEPEFPSPKMDGAQEGEPIPKRAPGNRFSPTSWRGPARVAVILIA